MPRIINSKTFVEMEKKLDTFFGQVDRHNKKNRQKITNDVQDFLDKYSESFVNHCRQLFINVREEDIIYYKSRDKRNGEVYSIDPLSDYVNSLQIMITTLIAGQEDPRKRVFYYEMFIQLMNSCYRKGDLSSATAIWSGLRSNNLENYVDMKKMSSATRLIWEECSVELEKIANPKTTIIAHEELRRQLKGVIIPSLNPLLQIQANCKEVYDRRLAEAQEKLKEIEPKLHKLDREMHQFLNQLDKDYSTWSQEYYDYMSTVYLHQCQFKYQRLLQEYEEHFDYIGVAKEFHNDQSAERFIHLLDRCFVENRTLKKGSSPDEEVVELLEEVEEFCHNYPGDITLDLYDLVKDNCSVVKAKNLGEHTSKIMVSLNKQNKAPGSCKYEYEQPNKVEYIQPTYDGIKLVNELSYAIEKRDPKVTSVAVGQMHCGFFNGAPTKTKTPDVESSLVQGLN